MLGVIKWWIMNASMYKYWYSVKWNVFFQGIHGISKEVRLWGFVFCWVLMIAISDMYHKNISKIDISINFFPFSVRPAVSGLPVMERNIKSNKWEQINSSEIYLKCANIVSQKDIGSYLPKLLTFMLLLWPSSKLVGRYIQWSTFWFCKLKATSNRAPVQIFNNKNQQFNVHWCKYWRLGQKVSEQHPEVPQ